MKYQLKRGFKSVGSREVSCLRSGWWAVCRGGLRMDPQLPRLLATCFFGGTTASLGKVKCGGDIWFFSEVLLKGGLGDPTHLVKAESPWSKQAVVKLKGMKDRRQESLYPPYPCVAGRHTSGPYQAMAHGQTLLPYGFWETEGLFKAAAS